MNILSMAPAFVQRHTHVALVTVVAARGSTPRHAGAHMLVSRDGSICGSIGGGRVELYVIERSLAVAEGGDHCVFSVDLVQDVAMCCGGTMEFLVEPLSESLLAILEKVGQAHAERRTLRLHTDLAGGGKRLEDSSALGPAASRTGTEFVEVLRPPDRLLLFGCGHLARAIGPLARELDFLTVACDDNQTASLDSPMSWANQVVASFELRDLERQLGSLGAGDYALVITRDHAIDQRIVEALLPRAAEFEYVGLIGSLGKIGRFKKRILAKGAVDQECWAQLRAPMGLNIHAETPTEIAVSIMAELVQRRAQRRPR